MTSADTQGVSESVTVDTPHRKPTMPAHGSSLSTDGLFNPALLLCGYIRIDLLVLFRLVRIQILVGGFAFHGYLRFDAGEHSQLVQLLPQGFIALCYGSIVFGDSIVAFGICFHIDIGFASLKFWDSIP